MSFLMTVKGLLFPAKCVCCGKSIKREMLPLCPVCRDAYERVKSIPCKRCGEKYGRCRCAPLVCSSDVSRYLSVCRYDKCEPGGRMLLRLKDRNDPAICDFLARELAKRLYHDRAVRTDALLCYVPRDPDKVLKLGVDQSRELTKALSKELKLPVVQAFVHRKNSESQKAKGASARKRNARESYSLHRACPPLYGKQVVLVDDILTTGATIAACAALLKEAGADEILALTVGRTALK